jgi:hypothetical protein
MVVKVLKPFRDLKANVDREAGDEFAASSSRAEEIARKLPGYVEVLDEPKEDLSALSVEQLRKLAAERGVKVKGTKKADYVAALEG